MSTINFRLIIFTQHAELHYSICPVHRIEIVNCQTDGDDFAIIFVKMANRGEEHSDSDADLSELEKHPGDF